MSANIQGADGKPEHLPASSALLRLAELATELGSDDIARIVIAVADRVSEGQFYVACVGQFKRGKSTLLNALVGHSVLPAGVIPVTSVPTIIRYGERLAARVRIRDTGWKDISVETVDEFVSEEKNPENARGVTGIEIFVPSALLEAGMCLVDTPGLGSVHAGNAATTRAFVPHIDAAIVVIGADPPLSGEELELIIAIASSVRELFFVLNKSDRVSEVEREVAAGFARKVLQPRLGRPIAAILEVSALERLEGKGALRDWAKLIDALTDLVTRSGRHLVQEAAARELVRASDQLLVVIEEERNALRRPREDSERRVATLRQNLGAAEQSMHELAYLFAAEQQRLSEEFTKQRSTFLKQARVAAHERLADRLIEVRLQLSGPRYRRDVMRCAQAIANAELIPWLELQTDRAKREFQTAGRRFIELGNKFLQRFAESGMPGLNDLPEPIDEEEGWREKSQYRFKSMETIAAPASPFRFLGDAISGVIGFRTPILRDAHDFLDYLLEVNSARVKNDLDDRVGQSRHQVESSIKTNLRQAMVIAERALRRAAIVQDAGLEAVETSLNRLDHFEQVIHRRYEVQDDRCLDAID